jgi:hypothetical protein
MQRIQGLNEMFIYVERFTLGHLHNEVKILLNKAALVIQTLFKKVEATI